MSAVNVRRQPFFLVLVAAIALATLLVPQQAQAASSCWSYQFSTRTASCSFRLAGGELYYVGSGCPCPGPSTATITVKVEMLTAAGPVEVASCTQTGYYQYGASVQCGNESGVHLIDIPPTAELLCTATGSATFGSMSISCGTR